MRKKKTSSYHWSRKLIENHDLWAAACEKGILIMLNHGWGTSRRTGVTAIRQPLHVCRKPAN